MADNSSSKAAPTSKRGLKKAASSRGINESSQSSTTMPPATPLDDGLRTSFAPLTPVYGHGSPAVIAPGGGHYTFAGSSFGSSFGTLDSSFGSRSMSLSSDQSTLQQPRTIPTPIADKILPSNAGDYTVFSGNKNTNKDLDYLPAWQRQFSEDNLPVELGILEPRRGASKKRTDQPEVKDDKGNVVCGCDGRPLRQFLYEGRPVLPNRIPENEETWRLMAWQMWAPDIAMTDYAVRMHTEQKNHLEIERETRRLNSAMGRYRKERGGLSMQRRPSGSIAKNELFVINRLSKKPFDWTLNTAYNTIWIVNEAAGTVTQPDQAGKATSNVHKLSDFGPRQPISPRVADIRQELSGRQQDAIKMKTSWDKLQFGDQQRHRTRQSNLARRKALGMPTFKKSLKDDTLPSVRPKRKTNEPTGDSAFNTALPPKVVDGVFEEDVPTGFGRMDFEGPIILGNPNVEEVNDFVRAAFDLRMPFDLTLQFNTDTSTTDLPELDEDALSDMETGEGLGQAGPSSESHAGKHAFQGYAQDEAIPDQGLGLLNSSVRINVSFHDQCSRLTDLTSSVQISDRTLASLSSRKVFMAMTRMRPPFLTISWTGWAVRPPSAAGIKFHTRPLSSISLRPPFLQELANSESY